VASRRYDPDRVVQAIRSRGYSRKIGLERIVLRKRGASPILIALQYPLYEIQARTYLASAGFSESEIRMLLEEWNRLDGQDSFHDLKPPFEPE